MFDELSFALTAAFLYSAQARVAAMHHHPCGAYLALAALSIIKAATKIVLAH